MQAQQESRNKGGRREGREGAMFAFFAFFAFFGQRCTPSRCTFGRPLESKGLGGLGLGLRRSCPDNEQEQGQPKEGPAREKGDGYLVQGSREKETEKCPTRWACNSTVPSRFTCSVSS